MVPLGCQLHRRLLPDHATHHQGIGRWHLHEVSVRVHGRQGVRGQMGVFLVCHVLKHVKVVFVWFVWLMDADCLVDGC